jgi:predicted AlkP superfamily pyrophosphatase or phosphodiesterase
VKALGIAVVLAACAPHGGRAVPVTGSAPRLVVVLIIDQFPEWAFEAKRSSLHGGFARLLATGEWHVGRHPQAVTVTAPGHALIGTGEPPARSGILANQWWSRERGAIVHAVDNDDGSVTSTWLRVPGLGDAVVAAHTGAKAVAVSLKSRSAVLPLGHAGEAIWYDTKTTLWTSLLPSAPAWLVDWNRTHPVAARLHDIWTPLDPTRLAELAGEPDAVPGETGEKHFGPTFPHDPQTTKLPAEAIFAMPLGNELVLDTALAAIDGEQLGTDRTPDLLVVSLSAHDYVGHGWGHESWEAWDTALRLDAALDHFLAELDRIVGAGRWAMIATSDHGASPLPEKVGGGRLLHRTIADTANAAATAVLGPGTWIDDAHFPYIYFSKPMLALAPEQVASATDHVIRALRALPGLERVDRVPPLVGGCDARAGDDRVLCLAFDRERSGDVFYMPARGWILEDDDEAVATSHGSLHDYDQRVPLIVVAPGSTAHAAASAPGTELDMTRVAPMVAGWLGVAAPADMRR